MRRRWLRNIHAIKPFEPQNSEEAVQPIVSLLAQVEVYIMIETIPKQAVQSSSISLRDKQCMNPALKSCTRIEHAEAAPNKTLK